jgi:hypothetical protein
MGIWVFGLSDNHSKSTITMVSCPHEIVHQLAETRAFIGGTTRIKLALVYQPVISALELILPESNDNNFPIRASRGPTPLNITRRGSEMLKCSPVSPALRHTRSDPFFPVRIWTRGADRPRVKAVTVHLRHYRPAEDMTLAGSNLAVPSAAGPLDACGRYGRRDRIAGAGAAAALVVNLTRRRLAYAWSNVGVDAIRPLGSKRLPAPCDPRLR